MTKLIQALRGGGPSLARFAAILCAAILAVSAAAMAFYLAFPAPTSSALSALSAPPSSSASPISQIAAQARTLFGATVWLIPAMMAVWAARIYRRRAPRQAWRRLAMLAPGLIGAAGYAEAHADKAGGDIGAWAVTALLGLGSILSPGAPYLPIGLALGATAITALSLGAGLTREDVAGAARFLFDANRDVARAAPDALRRVREITPSAPASLSSFAGASRASDAAPPPVETGLEPPNADPPPVDAGETPGEAGLDDLGAGHEAGVEASLEADLEADLDADFDALARGGADLDGDLRAAPGRELDKDSGGDLDRAPDTDQTRPTPAPTRRAPLDPPFVASAPGPRRPPPPPYIAPPTALYAASDPDAAGLDADELEEMKDDLARVLGEYGVRGEITDAQSGPVVTLFELKPEAGTRAARVVNLADDIARSMGKSAARIASLPERGAIGVELPNDARATVSFRDLLEGPAYVETDAALPLALGQGISGDDVVVDLAKMPHLLIAGATGSGKSVAINTMILSLAQKLGPEDCRFIMIDPKMLELSIYDGVPHLLAPVVTDPAQAVRALKWVVREMESRYEKMSKLSVRNLASFNERVLEAQAAGEQLKRVVQVGFDDDGAPIYNEEVIGGEKLPMIVVVVDEMADLMMTAGKEIEACVQRLAQMARASGIHLVMATQRPSVDVITGVIKANFPTRISFQVTSKIDSRTILGVQGAEQLLGMGDMLYMTGGGRVIRAHGPFVSDKEVAAAVAYLRQIPRPDYRADFDSPDIDASSYADAAASADDALYEQAVNVILRDRKASTSHIQRQLQIGYNRAARMMERMEAQGVVGPANNVGRREILIGGDMT